MVEDARDDIAGPNVSLRNVWKCVRRRNAIFVLSWPHSGHSGQRLYSKSTEMRSGSAVYLSVSLHEARSMTVAQRPTVKGQIDGTKLLRPTSVRRYRMQQPPPLLPTEQAK